MAGALANVEETAVGALPAKLMLIRARQALNADSSMEMTLSGIVILAREVQPATPPLSRPRS